MCNTSLEEDCLTISQRHVLVTPRRKKAGVDQADVQIYCPVSNLIFTSKIVEKPDGRQLVSHLELYGLVAGAIRLFSWSLDRNSHT